ncbi:MAG: hypothetical protein ACKO8Z_16405, partial [Prosthecobacter sp.]
GSGFAFPVINPEQQLGLLKTVSLGTLQIFSLVIGIVSTALLLPKDMEDRTLYTILSKPVPRFEYLAGKLLGVLLLIGGGLIIMDLVLSVVIYTRQGMVMQEALRALEFNSQATPETIERLKDIVAKQGLTWEMHWAVVAIFLKASVVTTLSLVLACIASSTLFTIIVALCAVIIGHAEHLLREFFLHPYMSGQLERFAALVLAMIFPDLAQFDIVDGVVAGESVPLSAVLEMGGLAALYVGGYLTIAHLLFVEKEL